MQRREFLLNGGIALGGLLVLPKLIATAESATGTPPQKAPEKITKAGGAGGNGPFDAGELTKAQLTDLTQVHQWLADALQQAGFVNLPELILTTAQIHPELAAQAGLQAGNRDAYAIFTAEKKIYLIGANVTAIRYAAAQLLRELGFRFYAPSPRWHIMPKPQASLSVKASGAPAVGSRSIWYAYGMPDKQRMADYDQWVFGNRLTAKPLINVGHSYGDIILRNQAEFAAHPEYYALLPDGKRDTARAINARKFCVSNPGLEALVAQDRIKLLGELRKANPLAYMVSVEPSDGEGVCECDNCKRLGSPSDRVFYLANAVARKIRAVYPDAWVGLYAYSDHRLPPDIAIEPNVYVQIAMAFNKTQYTLPQLVELWSKKISALGLREYYGVEAWDWGLPGRMRGGNVDYLRQWIPYYTARKMTSINAETNANWGGQMLGLYIASELMWDTKADVDALVARFFTDCYGPAAPAMKSLQAKFDAAAPLNPPTLAPMYADVEQAYQLAQDPQIRARISDMMAYLLYVDQYRRFDLVADSQPSRNDIYYGALKTLMTFAWRIRDRDMVHYYALARRLCNGLPKQDKRPEFYMYNKSTLPVWMAGEAFTDDEIHTLFHGTAQALQTDKSVYASFSRYFERVHPPGPDAGASHLPKGAETGVGNFRGALTGYLIASGTQSISLGVKTAKKPVSLKVFGGHDATLLDQTITDAADFQTVTVNLPKAGEYRFEIKGDVTLLAGSDVPLIFEVSVSRPAMIDYSGPYYFYVPKGVKQIFLDGDPRLSFFIPGVKQRQDITPANRAPGQTYSVVDVPEGAAGQVWHTDNLTRGKISFLNIPPFLCANRDQIFVPREVAEADDLTTAQ
jgi:hypothetical protein